MAGPKFGVRYRSAVTDKGDRFAVGLTRAGLVNFWHISGDFVRLYSFKSVKDKYDRSTTWYEGRCRELLADLMSPKPSVEVTRFVVNGQIVFTLDKNDMEQYVPKTPAPLSEKRARTQKAWEKVYLEDKRMFKEDVAPLILYGKFSNCEKEYAWKLFPNRPCRQRIKPGNLVMVKTRGKESCAKVTRIEEAGDKEQPTQYVLRRVNSWNSGKKAKNAKKTAEANIEQKNE